MCEEHSDHSLKKKKRLESKTERKQMDFEIVESIIEECAPLGLKEIIPSTMGEPLLYRHFREIVDICREYDIKLNLTTNGSFPGMSAEDWANLIVPVASDVKISWNGFSKEVQEGIMIGSKFHERLSNLKSFLKIRKALSENECNACSVTLQMTFMEANLHEIPKVVEMAIKLGIDRVKGHHLWVHSEEMEEQNLRRNSDSIKRWNKIASICQKIAKDNPLQNGEVLRLDNFDSLDINNLEELHKGGICPFLGKEAWINYEGRFDPCCAPDDLRRGLGDFGNVMSSGLIDSWKGENYTRLFDNYLDNELCLGCNMRRPIKEVYQ
jgi:MoaA/NifB/PqqE/SkfB family radical SAM enzyme